MRMKDDHMMNGQLKPGYNLQIATGFVSSNSFSKIATNSVNCSELIGSSLSKMIASLIRGAISTRNFFSLTTGSYCFHDWKSGQWVGWGLFFCLLSRFWTCTWDSLSQYFVVIILYQDYLHKAKKQRLLNRCFFALVRDYALFDWSVGCQLSDYQSFSCSQRYGGFDSRFVRGLDFTTFFFSLIPSFNRLLFNLLVCFF